jgi:hypothetical protein
LHGRHANVGELPSTFISRIADFVAKGDRKNVEMSANDTLVGLYEHAAERLLQRCITRQEAIHAIVASASPSSNASNNRKLTDCPV